MEKISGHYLFVINAFLIVGLVGIGFWLQQSSPAVTPASPPTASSIQIVSTASNTAANITPIVASTTLMVGQNNLTTIPTSTVISQKKTTTTGPVIQGSRENEAGKRYHDE